MKRRASILLLVIVFLLTSSVVSVSAYDAKGHDSIMNEILFGNAYYEDTLLSDELKNKIEMLEDASYLCVDQYNGNGKDELKFLRNKGVKSIPKDISEIDFTGNSTHRKYTHMGWNASYSEDKGNWNVRKDILVKTVTKVFGFKKHWDWKKFNFSYDAKCDAFSSLIYYIHIFGDILEQDKYNSATNTIAFVVYNPDTNNPDLFYELTNVFSVLFSDLEDSWTYIGFNNQFNSIATKARDVLGKDDSTEEDKFYQLKTYEYELKKLLVEYVPGMLTSESFFSNIFGE